MKKKKARSKAAKKTKPRKAAKSNAKAKKTSPKRPPAKTAKKGKSTRKASKKTAPPSKSGVIAPVNGVLLGLVEDYYAKIGVIALTLKASVACGQKIQVLGHTTNFEQMINSMQIDHAPVTQAKSGDGVGVKVLNRVRAGDHVYLLK